MKKALIALVICIVVFLAGVVVGRTTRKSETDVEIVVDPVLVASLDNLTDISKILKDYYKPVVETIPFGRDTIIITDDTPLGEVPWRAIDSSGVATTVVNEKFPMDIPWHLYMRYKGSIDTFYLELGKASTTITVDVKQPVTDFYGTISAIVLTDWSIKGD